jgi:hypothetical protein
MQHAGCGSGPDGCGGRQCGLDGPVEEKAAKETERAEPCEAGASTCLSLVPSSVPSLSSVRFRACDRLTKFRKGCWSSAIEGWVSGRGFDSMLRRQSRFPRYSSESEQCEPGNEHLVRRHRRHEQSPSPARRSRQSKKGARLHDAPPVDPYLFAAVPPGTAIDWDWAMGYLLPDSAAGATVANRDPEDDFSRRARNSRTGAPATIRRRLTRP